MNEQTGIVAGVLVCLMVIRELVPILRKASAARTVPPPAPSPADASGQHHAFPPERLATARELEHVRTEVHTLAQSVARLEERLGPVVRYLEREIAR